VPGGERVLVVNAGSSSLKLRLLGPSDEVLVASDLPATDEFESALSGFMEQAPEPDAVGHRVVHGGAEFPRALRVDGDVEDSLGRLADLAPLHNPPALRAMHALRSLRPDLPAVACFDTAFHATLPPEASAYALPAEWVKRWPLRRFGFHGLSHAYAARRAAELLERPLEELRLVTAHLGAGASLAAVSAGRSVDTTMGFTPMEGLVMATRSGSVDPGLLLWVQRHGELGVDEAERALDREAGLLGLSGRSGDMREVIAGAEDGDERCRLAFNVYVHRLAASVAAMAASMSGIDGLVFTGGVGENSALVRGTAGARLSFLGAAIDDERNGQGQDDRLISPSEADVQVLVVAAREDLEIAREVRALLA
jgi:acetate kinase